MDITNSTSAMTGIFIIEDHKVVIDSLTYMFNSIEDKIKIYGSAMTAKDAIEKLKTSKAEIILLDLVLPDMSGAELCKYLKQSYPSKKIIVLTGESRPDVLKRAWDNGANAILTKYCDARDLIKTIYDVISGIKVIGPHVPEFLLYKNPNQTEVRADLTEREKLILSLLAQGYTRKQICRLLEIKKNTIDTHCKNLFKKFDKKKMIDILLIAKKAHLIQ